MVGGSKITHGWRQSMISSKIIDLQISISAVCPSIVKPSMVIREAAVKASSSSSSSRISMNGVEERVPRVGDRKGRERRCSTVPRSFNRCAIATFRAYHPSASFISGGVSRYASQLLVASLS